MHLTYVQLTRTTRLPAFLYVDNTYLIVCDSNTHTIPKELQHISEWATRHNLKLNQAKSKEIILSLNKTPVSAATFLTRVESLTVLGITFNSKLRFEPHISYITHSAARCLYGLKTLRAHGLAGKSLWDVTQATLIARILYAAPAWWGFLNAAEKDRIESVINEAQRYGYLPSSFENVHSLVDNMESKLFNIVFCLIRGMSCINYDLLKRILDIACGHVPIILLCLSPIIIWSGRIFCTECYLWIPTRCMCRCISTYWCMYVYFDVLHSLHVVCRLIY